MATKFYMSYLRQSEYPSVHEVLRVHLVADKHIRLYVDHLFHGQPSSMSFDFRNAEQTPDSIQPPRGYNDNIYRYMIDSSDTLHVWICCPVPANTDLPDPAYQEVEHSSRATIFLANGQADAIVGGGGRPSWIPGALSKSDFIAQMKPRITAAARNFDNGFKWHWMQNALLGDDLFTAPTDSAEANRFKNTNWWGRTWAGYVYKVLTVDFAAADSTITQATVRTLVEQMEAELPNSEFIFTWYRVHDVSTWDDARDVALIGGAVSYSLYRTDTANGRFNGAAVVTLNQSDWEAVMMTHYNNALRG